MKARPMKRIPGAWIPCTITEAKYVELHTPGPFPSRMIPVCVGGSRDEASKARQEPVWSWNGDTENPTLRPSIRTQGAVYLDSDVEICCHSWVTNGKIQFLPDSTHQFSGETMDLLEVEE